MASNLPRQTCMQCGAEGAGQYCNQCGQSYTVKQLTIANILHEVFHFFSHLEHGFPFTLKKLITSPGLLQRKYVEGHRSKHQKPFSMFFLCITFAALMYYWINLLLVKHFDAGDEAEVSFFHQYMVILQLVMLPVYALITYIFFIKSKYNYAETLVLQLYTFSLILLMAAVLQLLKFIWPHMETRYVEFPAILVYIVITNVMFYNDIPKWVSVLTSIFVTTLCFLLATFIQDKLVTLLPSLVKQH